jgi:YHS domain-containing protein
MKALRVVVAVLLGAGFAWAFQGKPVNDTCPVKGEPIKANITTTYNGKTVAFCWGNCKTRFESDPASFASKIGPQPRTALNSISDALKAGKEGTKPAFILFMDAGAKSKMWSELLGDKELDDTFAKVAYAAVLFEKGSDEAKKYSISAAPVIVLVDPGENKSLKTITSPAAKTIKTEVENAIKKMTKK